MSDKKSTSNTKKNRNVNNATEQNDGNLNNTGQQNDVNRPANQQTQEGRVSQDTVTPKRSRTLSATSVKTLTGRTHSIDGLIQRSKDLYKKGKKGLRRVSERLIGTDSLNLSSTDKLLREYEFYNRTSADLVSPDLETITLYEEFRLIERPDIEIKTAWKGAHLTVFFLSFVFGSFCTFCFHVLMYLFDEKCVLYPKMVSIQDLKKSSTRQALLDHISRDLESLPLDFVTTIWMDKSTCYLPTYVPLLSALCGLVWTTMFLMCSAGSQTLTGLNRPWRILPVVFCFSVVMSVLCVYTTIITHNGLEELCTKLGEVFGNPTCSFTINVATIAYERRIRGVYQATRLTIMSAWLHTLCWISSAALALARVVLVVDFRLVRVRADLIGNIEQVLERQETLIRTDDFWPKEMGRAQPGSSRGSVKVRFVNKGFGTENEQELDNEDIETHYISNKDDNGSEMALDPLEIDKLKKRNINQNDPEHLEKFGLRHSESRFNLTTVKFDEPGTSSRDIGTDDVLTEEQADKYAAEFRNKLNEMKNKEEKMLSKQLSAIFKDEELPSSYELEELWSKSMIKLAFELKNLKLEESSLSSTDSPGTEIDNISSKSSQPQKQLVINDEDSQVRPTRSNIDSGKDSQIGNRQDLKKHSQEDNRQEEKQKAKDESEINVPEKHSSRENNENSETTQGNEKRSNLSSPKITENKPKTE